MVSTAAMFHVEQNRPTISLVKFSNGKLNKKYARRLKFSYFKEKQEGEEKPRVTLVAKTKKLCYVGQNFGEEAESQQKMCRYYVGIRDKSTGKMRVCDTEIFNIHPNLTDVDQVDSREVAASSFSDQREILISAFGNKKKKLMMQMRKQNAISGNVLNAAMKTVTDHALAISHDKIGETDPQVVVPSEIPPCRIDAKTPQDVYNLNDIISLDEMNSLSKSAQVLCHSAADNREIWREQKTYSSYVLNHLEELSRSSLSEAEKEARVQCLLYLEYMMMIFKMDSRNFKKEFLPRNCPYEIAQNLFDRFTTNSKRGRCMSAKLRDKLICYILVLCLILDNFRVSFSSLSDLKLPERALADHHMMQEDGHGSDSLIITGGTQVFVNSKSGLKIHSTHTEQLY